MVKETPVLFKNVRREGYDGSYASYVSSGGFDALKKTLAHFSPEDVTNTVKQSNLRGRGGAGFPTGLKWSFMAKNTGKPSYLICNADESEPGTFKDREIMLKDPFLLLEGLIIGCYAIGCNHSYIYVRGEFFPAIKKLTSCIRELYDNNYLGKNILHSGFDIDITVHAGAGAYICGEETALLDSLEGKRGQPRVKPPFPAVSGFNGCPTSVNNVETIANIPIIFALGADQYNALGTPNNAGTRIICLSGNVKRPGAYEVEMGENFGAIIDDLGGGVEFGKKMKGVIPGGSSVPVLLPDEIDIGYDYDSVAKAGSLMGSCGIVVLDEDVNIPKFLLRILSFYNHESCGQCTPCREGMHWLKVLLRDVIRGKHNVTAIARMERIANNIMGNTLCALGDAGAMPTLAFIKKYRREFESLTTQQQS